MKQTSLLILLWISAILPSAAQTLNTLTIEAPENIAGNYFMVGANFGLQTIDSIEGKLILGLDSVSPESDGCTELVNTLEGNICLLDRGECAFDKKVLHAQQAGAIAVIICNNNEKDPFLMYGTEYISLVNIYAGMISMQNCDSIKMEMANNEINIKLHFKVPPCISAFGEDVVWGQNGEGEFDGGLGDWTAEDSLGSEDVFAYSEYGINQGAIRPGGFAINSSTVCNGVASMDFDFYTTNGNPDILDNLTEPYPNYTGHLTSPSIDLSDVDNPVVHFQQYQGVYDGYYSFQYSIDNGLTWSEEEIIDTENVITATISVLFTEEKFIEIPEAAFQPEVKIRFLYNQVSFYVWMLDDIYINGDKISSVKEDELSNSLSLFPNPSNGSFNIKLDHEISTASTIKIQSIEGKIIYSDFLSEGIKDDQELSIKNLPEGLYLFSIENELGVISEKMIVRH